MKQIMVFNYGVYHLIKNSLLPKFKKCAKHPHIDEMGYVLYYTSQCPFNAKICAYCRRNRKKKKGVQFKSIHLQSKEQAQNAPTPITTYALFYNGEYLTNEQMNDKRFFKVIGKITPQLIELRKLPPTSRFVLHKKVPPSDGTFLLLFTVLIQFPFLPMLSRFSSSQKSHLPLPMSYHFARNTIEYATDLNPALICAPS